MVASRVSYPDTAPRDGNPSPLTEATILGIKDCLVVISSREAELAHPVVWRHLRHLIENRFPDDQGRWWADLAPVDGPTFGPFDRRTQALDAERAWLEAHWPGSEF